MLQPQASAPRADFDEAWRNILMCTEHTYTYENPSEPYFQDAIWKMKQRYFREAEERSQKLLDEALAPATDKSNGALGPVEGPSKRGVAVFNTQSWPHGGLVTLAPAESQTGNRVEDEQGREVPSHMEPGLPKAVWGFNGTERPGAVYLAAVLAGHNQKGLPAFGIYGRDVQDSDDTGIPEDVQEKLLRFARAGLAVATMRGKSYVSRGSVSMGIAGSIVDQAFFERYLGMRVKSVDMVEFIRRMQEGIYDPVEFGRAYTWVRANCPEGKDYNPPENQRSRAQKDEDWRISVKMALIARDLMVGNPRLVDLGYGEEAFGHNAILGGFQGQRQWTDFMPNGDFLEAMLNSSFDWNGIRQPYIFATENDALNGVSMLFGHLLTGTAQIFADVRTFWSPDAVQRVSGHTLSGRAAGGFLHLINSGPAALDAPGLQGSTAVGLKAWRLNHSPCPHPCHRPFRDTANTFRRTHP